MQEDSSRDEPKADGEPDPLFDDLDAEGSSTDGGGTEAVAESLGVPSKKGEAFVHLPGPPILAQRIRPKWPKPMDASLPKLSTDVLLGSCIDGQMMVWDRRATKGPVRAFARPKGKAPWAMTVRFV